MYITVHDGIIFIEGAHPEAQILSPVSVSIRGAFISTQLRSLDHVKDKMVSQVIEAGANAVVQFKYGQKSKFLGSLFNRDDMVWYGEGFLAVLPDEDYQEYLRTKS